MAIAASMLRSEMRRHLLMNVTLVASCVVGGTVVTNECGLFVPLSIHGMSETARAFAAMFTQSHMLADSPDLSDVRMVSPLAPFEVTADSRDLRRRLMDSLGWLPEQASEYNKELAQISNTTLTPTEFAQNNVTGGPTSGGAAGGDGAPAAGQTQQSQQSTQTPATEGGSPLTGSSTSDVLPSSSTLTSQDVTPAQANVINNPTPTDTTPTTPAPPADPTLAVPEPSTWAMLIAGFGMVGFFLRSASRRRREAEAPAVDVV